MQRKKKNPEANTDGLSQEYLNKIFSDICRLDIVLRCGVFKNLENPLGSPILLECSAEKRDVFWGIYDKKSIDLLKNSKGSDKNLLMLRSKLQSIDDSNRVPVPVQALLAVLTQAVYSILSKAKEKYFGYNIDIEGAALEMAKVIAAIPDKEKYQKFYKDAFNFLQDEKLANIADAAQFS